MAYHRRDKIGARGAYVPSSSIAAAAAATTNAATDPITWIRLRGLFEHAATCGSHTKWGLRLQAHARSAPGVWWGTWWRRSATSPTKSVLFTFISSWGWKTTTGVNQRHYRHHRLLSSVSVFLFFGFLFFLIKLILLLIVMKEKAVIIPTTVGLAHRNAPRKIQGQWVWHAACIHRVG